MAHQIQVQPVLARRLPPLALLCDTALLASNVSAPLTRPPNVTQGKDFPSIHKVVEWILTKVRPQYQRAAVQPVAVCPGRRAGLFRR